MLLSFSVFRFPFSVFRLAFGVWRLTGVAAWRNVFVPGIGAVGDANLDRVFDSSDLVAVFQAGFYEQQVPAGWATGDWNCDGRFDSGDMVLAFQRGNYSTAAMPALSSEALPDPGQLTADDERLKRRRLA